jgi:hypothetical protein
LNSQGYFNDKIQILDLDNLVLRETRGAPDPQYGYPPLRYKHTGVLYTAQGVRSVYLFGGRNDKTTFGDLWRLSVDDDKATNLAVC